MRYRRYITNRYKRYIYPAIITSFTLTCIDGIDVDAKQVELNLDSVEILDGLQRTFRLWMAYKICTLIKKEGLSSHMDLRSYLAADDYGYLELDFVTSSQYFGKNIPY